MTDDAANEKNIVRVDFRARRFSQSAISNVHNEEKFLTFLDYYASGETTVFINTKARGLRLPPHLLAQPIAKLSFCVDYYLADFTRDRQGLRVTLSFREGKFCCEIPWHAVAGLHSPVLKSRKNWDYIPKKTSTKKKKPDSQAITQELPLE